MDRNLVCAENRKLHHERISMEIRMLHSKKIDLAIKVINFFIQAVNEYEDIDIGLIYVKSYLERIFGAGDTAGERLVDLYCEKAMGRIWDIHR